MNGVTTAIVAFIFLALAFPSLIKDKTQYYASLLCVILVILLDAMAHAFVGMAGFAYFIGAILQIGAVIMLVLSTGGLTVRQFGREVTDVADAMMRGEKNSEVVVPLSAAAVKKPDPADQPQRRVPRDENDHPTVYTLGDPNAAAPVPHKPPAPTGPLPLE
jgi:hypothetical protein